MERITKKQHSMVKQIVKIFFNKINFEKSILDKSVRPVSSAPV